MVSTFIGLLDIQSWWEIPCIAHFCSLFSSAFNLPDIDIEELESALLTDGTDDTVGLLPELIVSLLKGCDALRSQHNEITTSNYQMFLRRFLRHQCRQHNTENYFDSDVDFQALPLRNKLLILYSLCHFRLDSKNVQDVLSNLQPDSLRVEPLGYDSKNSGYWYFYGTRLYREDIKAGGKSSIWQVICFTEEDWQNLATKFQKSKSPKERALYHILTQNFLPKLPQLFRERERLRRRKLLQVRNSARIRALVEEKQKQFEKHQAELLERQKLEEQLKQEAANKTKSRSKRRSSQSSTASGISTYASSVKGGSTNSSEFLSQREKFCLSPDVEDNHSSPTNTKDLTEKAADILNESIREVNEEFPENIKISVEVSPKRPGTIPPKVNSCVGSSDNTEDYFAYEDKENCCFLPSIHSESELSGGESQSSVQKIEMAPTTNIKLPGRQTNNSLSTLTGNIFLPTVFGSNTTPAATESTKAKEKSASSSTSNSENSNRKKKAKGAEVFTETDEVLQIGMHKVLVYVKNHRDAWPFMDPVEEDIAPRYYSIIRRPMDLLKMEEKLDNGEYARFSEFRNDFKLIVNNCRLYNGQNNEYTEMVNNLQEAFDKATKKYFDHISSDEEGNMSYPDSKTNVFREKYFNKTNTNKVVPSDTIKKEKEEREKHDKFDAKNEKNKGDEVMEGSRANKRKRKDKDKRRKKKSKTKSSVKSEEEEEDNEDDEESNDEQQFPSSNKHHGSVSDEESGHEDLRKSKRKVSGGKKMPEHRKRREVSQDPQSSSSSTNKKPKRKSEGSKEDESEENSLKSNSSKKPEEKGGNKKQNNKSSKSNKESLKKNLSNSDNEGDVLSLEEEKVEDNQPEVKSDKEFSSDNSMIDYPIQGKSHKKHSSSQKPGLSTSKSAHSDRSKSTNTLNTKNKHEKENQNSKSKSKRSTSSTSVSTTEESDKYKVFHKDNRRDSSSSKKRRSKSKKQEESDSNDEPSYKRRDRDDSSSRSPSPLYKVDLHKKYAKSASIEVEDEFENNKHNISATNNLSLNSQKSLKTENENDLMSISSRSLSRSPSPFNSIVSEEHNNEKQNITLDSNSNSRKKSSSNNKNIEKSPPSSTLTQETELKLPPFMDKYDLIKQRRNRNTDEKWNQIVKEAEKIKDNKKSVPSTKPVVPVPSKEKNQKLRETIEKLKAKNAKSKERSVLIDEIFGVKPAQEVRDEKMIFEKLRETCLDSKSSTAGKKPETVEKQEECKVIENVPPVSPTKSKKKDSSEQKKRRSLSPKKLSSKKIPSTTTAPPPSKKNPNKTNMEALELETEQTLKDINRWLEHTPRFPEFSSASNSPSRYNLLDDFDALAAKLDPNDFKRNVPIATSKVEPVPKLPQTFEEIVENKTDVIPDLIPAGTNSAILSETTSITNISATSVQPKAKEPSTTQLLPHPPPPPPNVKLQIQKETKRKTLKDKLTNNNRRKDLLRTIDRLQPGKAKGNLMSNIHNVNKPEEIFPLGAAAKIKEVKNSLVVKTDETAPKLSLGSVLNTEGFGLGQLHNFGDDITSGDLKINDPICRVEAIQEKSDTSPVHETVEKLEDFGVKKDVLETKVETKVEKTSATPNLSAWFKAFGAPKKAKKAEEEEKRSESTDVLQTVTEKCSSTLEQSLVKNSFTTLKSPQPTESFPLPAPRQRKASTGSTISERSSFSQDPDSPRVGIDDRFGAYSGPYASPIGASPIMVSPKPEEITKPTSPYPLNGAIKVGFYQDTTTKSSPEKSCSPRELPSPYPQYSQHIYSSASSPNINSDINNTYGSCFSTTAEQNKTPMYSSTSPSPLYEQYKQPHSQESDYNSSMSPSTNPNSPYQQPQNSPYQHHQTSPYQQAQNSPYQQPQTSPFHNQSGTSQNMISTQPPNTQPPGIQEQQPCESPRDPNSPYQQSANSPYQQPTNSPYNQQNPASPYQQPQQQNALNFGQPQNTSSPTMDSIQQVASDRAFNQESPQYPVHENTPQFQQGNPPQMPYEQDIPKSPPNIINKIQTQPEWSNQMDVPSQPPQPNSSNITNLSALSAQHGNNQLNTPPLQPVQTEELNTVHHMQQDASKEMQYQRGYQHYAATANKDSPKPQSLFNNELSLDIMQQRQIAPQEQLVKSNQVNVPKNSQSGEPDLLTIGGYPEHQTNKLQKPEAEKPFDSTLNKHQQMFDSFLGSMTAGKNLSFGKPLDISTSKAFEMFNRAATMGFSKDFPNALLGANKPEPIVTPLQNNTAGNQPQQHSQQQQQGYHVPAGKIMENSANNPTANNKSVNMINYSQPPQMHLNQSEPGKLQTFQNIDNKLHQQQPPSIFGQKLTQQHQPNSYPTNLVQPSIEKINNELVIPNPRQDQMSGISRNQHLNMDLSNYKSTFNNHGMLDPLRNLNHPLAMVDESILGLQNSSSTGYYDKNIPPAHIFSKNLGQQVYQNPSPFGAREQQNPTSAYVPPVSNVPTAQLPLDGMDPKVSKRTKKKKSSTPTPVELAANQNQNAMLPGQQQLPLQGQAHQGNPNQQSTQNSQQGFQLYAGLKTVATSVAPTTDTSAISLKSATSMVPGSAFNFGPTPTGLGLPAGIYGDNSGYLEEFRGAPNPYYMPPGHRPTSDAKNDAAGNSGAPAPSSYHQFLTHTTPRTSYPFMNSPQLDPNSPIYQQYIQRQEELRARMMLNQGLLGPGAAAGYPHPQPGYRPATLGMPKPYDMNRQPWF